MTNQSLKKPTLVFLPGFGFKASVFQSIADQCTGYETLLCDLPNISENDQTQTFSKIVQTLNQILPEQSILVGWSLGGLFASALCQTFPRKYKKLILVSSSLKFLEDIDWQGIPIASAQQFSIEAIHHLETLLTKFTRLVGHPHHARLSKQLEAHAWVNRHLYVYQFYLRQLFQEDRRSSTPIQTQTLSIHGTHDSILPLSGAQQITSYFPHSDFYIIQGAGHAPFLSHSTEFTHHLLTFVSNPI